MLIYNLFSQNSKLGAGLTKILLIIHETGYIHMLEFDKF